MTGRTFLSPAKINLCLHVLGRREDGYHELAMAMQRVDLCDHIRIRLGGAAGIRVACAAVALAAGEENIVAKAARLILCEAESVVGVEIEVEKQIPVAAGLGGGSSNAATVLMALDELLDLQLGKERLMALGGQLGADVPFFVFAAPAWATGVGTQLEKLPNLPSVAYLLINPGIAVSTAWVYQSLRLTKGGELANLPWFSVATKSELCAALHNDLEQVTLERYPLLVEIKQLLLAQGALGALMSGSGATVFGVFRDFAEASHAGVELARGNDWLISPVRPL